MRFLQNCIILTKSLVNYSNRNLAHLSKRQLSAAVGGTDLYKVTETPLLSKENIEDLTEDEIHKKQDQNKQLSLSVAVIGVPNAGKSTFINNLINHRVCATSSKVHTTRSANKAIFTNGNTQIILYDTPGLVTQREIKKHNLEQSFISAYRHAIQHANLIAVLHDVSNSWTRNELHSTVLDTLKAYPALPSILVLNKIDALKSKRALLDLIRNLSNNTLASNRRRLGRRNSIRENRTTKDDNEDTTLKDLNKREVGWSHFSNIFLVSSVTGSGLNDIQNFFIKSATENPWQYSSDTFTDITPEELIVESVRARLLDYLPQEIPYNLKCCLEYYSVEKGTIYTSVEITCPSARIERLICGESNGKLRQISERISSDLVETFGKPISLTITTTSKKSL